MQSAQDHQAASSKSRCLVCKKALLCIDLQYMSCKKGTGVLDSHSDAGISEDQIDAYLSRVRKTVIPNVQRLQKHFRQDKHEVIHVRIQSLTGDGRDRSHEHKGMGLHASPGSKLAEFVPEVQALDNEIVVNKTASDVFIATNLEYILRNLCVTELYVVGVYTNECVSSAVRSASDLGFSVYLISDATAGTTCELHQATLRTLDNRYAAILTTDELISLLDEE